MDDDASITFGPLRIYVSGRQFPDSKEYWDANWLAAKAVFEGVGSRVEVNGSFVHLRELRKWKSDLEAFQEIMTGVVELPTIEPALKIKIAAARTNAGQLDCVVEITADQISERHRYSFGSDQSYLTGLLAELAQILRLYPILYEKAG